MKTWHGDINLKNKILTQLQAHYDADEIVKGQYWEDGKGCAVGCTIHSSNHALYESEFGIPEWLAKLEDSIFEGLENKLAKEWPLRFTSAIPEGITEEQLKLVKWKFLLFLMEENKHRVSSLEISENLKKRVIGAIDACIGLFANAIKNNLWDESAARSVVCLARSVESARWSASRSVLSADSAAKSVVWSAESEEVVWSTNSAARSVAESVRSEAEAASSAWSASSARLAAYKRYASKLIELLEKAQGE